MNRAYISTRFIRRYQNNAGRYTPELRLGYRINDTFSTYFDQTIDRWQVVHNTTGRSVIDTKTRKQAIIAAYAFLPYDMNQIVTVNESNGHIEWSSDESKDNAIITYHMLKNLFEGLA